MKNAFVVIPMVTPWDFSTDWSEQTARLLAKNNFVLCMLCSESLKTHFLKREIPKILTKIAPQLYLYQSISIIPFRRFALMRRANMGIHALITQTILFFVSRRRVFSQKIVWIFDPECSPFAQALGEKFKVVYDVVDYVLGENGSVSEYNTYIRAMDKRLLARASLVAVNSHTLYRLYKKDRRDVILVPQGFRLEAFKRSRVLPISVKIPRDKPIIGYVGGINNRLDFCLLESLVQRNPQYHFVLAGQIQDHEAALQLGKLVSHRNVLYLGNYPKHNISAIINLFDIGIIPYLKQPSNIYSFPTKLMEYFYMGKPVVSSLIEELRRFPHYVKIGKNETEWERYIQLLASRPWPREYQKEQRKLAIRNSWEEKIRVIYSHISE